ncbi:hypothetical protein AVEN_246890-1 [Araneus ventricosus]|uniref:Uncharacterized protein n=1 Tax=Araneus ventricosus TaxID=182803 RepID=A0A4Y2Q8M2_ARAVE|nr:hypothetical protein AVEN_246890-1 [Araneus ventricosus]
MTWIPALPVALMSLVQQKIHRHFTLSRVFLTSHITLAAMLINGIRNHYSLTLWIPVCLLFRRRFVQQKIQFINFTLSRVFEWHTWLVMLDKWD